MKILYVSQYFPPEMGAPAARVSELSRHWAEAGHAVTVLTGFPNHPTGRVPAEYRKPFRRLIARETFHGVNVIRTWLLPFPNRKAYERILNYVSFCISAGLAGMFADRADVVISTSPQLLVGLSGWWLAKFKRVPFIFEVRDLWPESLTAVGMGNERSMIHRILGAIARFLYRRSDGIVVVTPAFKDYLVKAFRIPPQKISIVHNGVETDLFQPNKSDSRLKQELAIENKFVVAYIGTIGMAHGLETLLEAATRLQQTHPGILFMFIGEGADKSRMIKIAASRNLRNTRFIDEQPREKIPAFISASDACVVLLKESDVFKTVIPTKMLEFMSCARPVVLGVDGQARKILEEAKAGIYIVPGDVGKLCEAVLRLKKDSALRENLGRNGRKYILQNFSRAETATAYLAVLESILGRPHASDSLAA